MKKFQANAALNIIEAFFIAYAILRTRMSALRQKTLDITEQKLIKFKRATSFI
ncbi:MAG: hypothetical protein M3Q99_18845 [Acidobacteriota bacterium]|nr:hypothetical protein [Acidobacteriota bacterium]